MNSILANPHHAAPADLSRLADALMEQQGLSTGFSDDELRQATLDPPPEGDLADMRGLLWSSIDNDGSRDLDQVEWAQAEANGSITIRVGVADVDTRVPRDTPLDCRALHNAASVYTPVKNFPMLPTSLSEHLTSLEANQDRPAIVTEFTVRPDGSTHADRVYRALLRNHAQLTYSRVSNWFEHPNETLPVPGLDAQLQLQKQVLSWLQAGHHATERSAYMVEEFMRITNEVNTHYLSDRGFPVLGHHTTAPNRLESDLVNQRILKACLLGRPSPYSPVELQAIAERCRAGEEASRTVERRLHAAMAAASMQDRIGQRFTGYVEAVSPEGARIRLDEPAVEGWLRQGLVRLGEQVSVAVQEVDIERGRIELSLAP